MSDLSVDKEMLRALLDAASMTALSHRGSSIELYVLGQLEATANMAYLLSVGKVEYEFESFCQKLATDAIERMEAITAPRMASINRQSLRGL